MNIVVCVKQVPDTAVERTLTPTLSIGPAKAAERPETSGIF